MRGQVSIHQIRAWDESVVGYVRKTGPSMILTTLGELLIEFNTLVVRKKLHLCSFKEAIESTCGMVLDEDENHIQAFGFMYWLCQHKGFVQVTVSEFKVE